MKQVWLLILMFVFPAVGHAVQPSIVFSDLLERQCIAPLEAEAQIKGEGMDVLPEAVAKQMAKKTTGKAWVSPNAHVALVELNSKGFSGCLVDFRYRAAKSNSINETVVIRTFNQWADQQIAEGRYINRLSCGNPDVEFFRMIESRFDRSRPIRVLLSYGADIPYIFAMAVETTDGAEVQPCQ